MTEQTDEEFDFVVIGSGAGSMCAGLVMRSLGKSVVILEKANLVGGATARSGGAIWVPNNRFMREAGIDDSPEQAIAYMDATCGQSEDAPGSTPERRAAYVEHAPEMIDFLVEQGIKFRGIRWPDYYNEYYGASAAGRIVAAEMFDTSQLGPWRKKLQPNFVKLPGRPEEFAEIALIKRSWRGKLAAVRLACRIVLSRLVGRHLVINGAALQGRMLRAALRAGVEVRTLSPVSSLIIEDGAAKGVVVKLGAEERQIRGRLGVLVNAGGFSQNQRMLTAHIPGVSARWSAAPAGDTGEMLVELMRVGAATGQLDEMVGNQFCIPPGRENQGDGLELLEVGGQMNIAKPHSIVVDQSGVRYQNECGSYVEFCKNMLRRNREVQAVPSWWIVDSYYMRTYMYCGTMPGTEKPKEWYDSGFLKRAETIEELAVLLEIEPAALRETIDDFNINARQGRDPSFYRGDRLYDRFLGDHYASDSPTLGPIEDGPFYAAPLVPGNVGTFGGAVTDEQGRVLTENGCIIPNLYATGTVTASVMGRCYPAGGASIGPAMLWGYLAALSAAGAPQSRRTVLSA